jgi:type IV pilus assembly protein PilE
MRLSVKSGHSRGFTLVELMIVVVVVAILAAVAYPAYTQYVARSHRKQLLSQVVSAQQWLERVYSETYRYPSNTAFQAQGFRTSPAAGNGAARYTLALSTVAADGQSYTLTATATGTMASDPCGNLLVTNTGVKSVTGFDADVHADAAAALAACWQ